MEQSNNTDYVKRFDDMFFSNQLCIYKVLFSFLPISSRFTLAKMIKLYEFQALLNGKLSVPELSMQEEATNNYNLLLDSILPYLPDYTQNQIKQFKDIFETMNLYKDMMDMSEMSDMSDLSSMFSNFTS